MTPARKPKGRTFAEFEPLRPAEKTLLDACWQGEVAHIADSCPEAEHENNTVRAAFLRFLALGGDGQAPVHERGVRLQGAWITGTLDLISASVPSDLGMVHCQFSETPFFTGTNIAGTLNFTGSQLPGFIGQGMTVNGNLICNNATFYDKGGLFALMADSAVIKGAVFLTKVCATGEVRLLDVQINGGLTCIGATFDGKGRHALSADRAIIKGIVFLTNARTTGEVRLLGTQIDGDLVCNEATFDGKEGYALSADGAVIKSDIFLKEANATGTVRLLGAQIGGSLECSDAIFNGKGGDALLADGAVIKRTVFLNNTRTTGTVSLLGAQIGGDLVCGKATFDGKEGYALAADGMTVTNTFFFENTLSSGRISLAGVHIGRLVDDINSWGKCVILDGLTYGSIAGGAPTNATTRLAWLNKQSPEHTGLNGQGADFKPQPWRQLAKVLREMGHAEDARQVSIAFEERLREADLIGKTPVLAKDICPQRSWIYRKTSRILHWWFGALTGYGYRPLRLLSWVLGVWLFCAAIYWGAALEGGYAPSSPPVFQNPAYAVCEPPKNNWYLCSQLSEAYSGFSPLAYSLDIILPFVDLQQETRWSPLISTPIDPWYAEFFTNWSWQHNIRLLVWFETLFGWLSGLLLAAVVSGLAKRRKE